MDNKLAPTLSSIFTLIYKQKKLILVGTILIDHWEQKKNCIQSISMLLQLGYLAIFSSYKYGIVSLFIQICSYWFYTVNFLDKRRSKAILQESDFTITLTNTSPSSTDNDDDQLDQTSEHQNIHAMVLTGFFFLFSLSFFSIHWFTPVR